MSFPDIPAGMGVPLVTLVDGLLPDDTMDALDSRYAGGTAALPPGGATGQVLTKDSGTDYDVDWQDVEGLPVGGSLGQVLTKQSGTDGDADWEDVPPGGTSPGVGMLIVPQAAAVSTTNSTTGRVTIVPIQVYGECSVNAFALDFQAASSAAHQVGLYPSNANGTPNVSSGPIVSATWSGTSGTGWNYLSCTSTPLTPGLYWIAFLKQDSISMAAINSAPFGSPYWPAGWTRQHTCYLQDGQSSLPSGTLTATLYTGAFGIFVGLRVV